MVVDEDEVHWSGSVSRSLGLVLVSGLCLLDRLFSVTNPFKSNSNYVNYSQFSIARSLDSNPLCLLSTSSSSSSLAIEFTSIGRDDDATSA